MQTRGRLDLSQEPPGLFAWLVIAVLALEAVLALCLGLLTAWWWSEGRPEISFDTTPLPQQPWYEDAIFLALAAIAVPGLFLAVIGIVDRGPTSRAVRIVLCCGLAVSIALNAVVWLFLLGGLGAALATSLLFGSVMFVCGDALVRQGRPLLRP